jgi:transposase
MVAERLAMETVRLILRSYFAIGLRGSRQIAQAARCGKTKVNDCLKQAAAAGLTGWAEIEALDDQQLESRLRASLAKPGLPGKPLPDWTEVHEELRRNKSVTLALLWEEYRTEHPDGYSYPHFVALYGEWRGKISLVMRQEHRGGEKVFVDFCDGLNLVDPKTQKPVRTYLFVGALGASSYTYACAVPSQSVPHWIECHERMYEYMGGVAAITVPDNLKSGIKKPDRYEAEPNSTYGEMAEHYSTCIIPARVGKPRDKAKAEAAVLVAERWILAVLRKRTFYSLSEMNEAIALLLERLNAKVMRHLKKSRRELWESLDRPCLKPLPATRYEMAEWKKVRLGIDYHIEFELHLYSAPFSLVKQELWVRATRNVIEIIHKNRRVASHQRSYRPYGKTTVAEHMPSSHRRHAEWTPERIASQAKTIGPACTELVTRIMDHRRHPEQGFRSAMGVIRLEGERGPEKLEKACVKALAIGAILLPAVRNILRNSMQDVPLAETLGNHEEEASIVQKTDLLAAENIRGRDYFQ